MNAPTTSAADQTLLPTMRPIWLNHTTSKINAPIPDRNIMPCIASLPDRRAILIFERSGRRAVLLLLQGEDGRIALRPVGRHQAGLRVVMRELGALAAHDHLVLGRADRVDGVRERIRGAQRIEEQRTAEV